jgi:hypothetical protein
MHGNRRSKASYEPTARRSESLRPLITDGPMIDLFDVPVRRENLISQCHGLTRTEHMS